MTQSTTQHFRGKALSYTPKFPYSSTYQNTAGLHRNSVSGVTVVHAQDVDSFRVRTLKSEALKPTRKSTGQYKHLTMSCQRYEYFIDRDTPDRLYRRDRTSTKSPTLVAEKLDGQWFPCVPMNTSEVNTLKPFIGSLVVDPDAAIQEGRRSIKRQGRNKAGDRQTKHERQAIAKHREKLKSQRSTKPKRKVAIR